MKGAGGAGGKRWLVTLREHTRSCAEQQARDTELRRLRHAVSTRAIGIYEHDHASNEIYASHALRVQYALDAERRLTIADFAGATHPHDSEFLLGEIAKAHDPVRMARAMRAAVEAGHQARSAGRIPRKRYAEASSPQLGLVE